MPQTVEATIPCPVCGGHDYKPQSYSFLNDGDNPTGEPLTLMFHCKCPGRHEFLLAFTANANGEPPTARAMVLPTEPGPGGLN